MPAAATLRTNQPIQKDVNDCATPEPGGHRFCFPMVGTPQLLAWSLACACMPAVADEAGDADAAPERTAQTLGR